MDACVAPSELHLKKEITTLQKARFLRDPETSSSWRSPLSSKSFISPNKLNNGKGIGRNPGEKETGEKETGKMLPISSSEGIRKRVYLYNWKHHSTKSSDSGAKLDEDDRHVSVEKCQEESFNNPCKVDLRRNSYHEASSNIYSVSGTNQEIPARRTVKKLRNAVSTKQIINNSVVTKLLDLPSTSSGVPNSVEQSDDTEYCNSEDLQLKHVLTNKTANHSPSVSPLFSGSGCGTWSYSSKFLRSIRKEVSSHSCTPASTSSYYRYGGQNASIAESWDGTTTSVDGDEFDQLDLPRNQGCGIPCYRRRRTKERGYGNCYSPSLSDTLRKKGSGLLCGSQTLYNKKKSSGSHKQRHLSKSSQGLPLLTNSCDGGNSSLDTASDELSIDFGELELEASSRLDGRRWSSCKSQEGTQSVQSAEADMDPTGHRALSQKYSPRSFDEIIGQNIAVHSLNNAILRGRIASAYLFQGPRGTGKTSTARIFAAALNCLSTEDNKPCGFCRECTSIFTGNGSNVREVDAINKKGIDRVSYLLRNMSTAKAVSRYKVFIIDECHMLSSRMWLALMNFLQEPPSHLVFIFITIDPDSLPRAILSRCQKYLFSKVKDADIICRLKKLSCEENLDINLDALDLIALHSDGSLQDAETMLEQLSLLGKRITASLVNELVGVVSDEKLLDLLEIAMSSDTAETVRRSRELMDSGVDPVALMSQLATLIMDIIAGTDRLASSECTGVALGEKSLSEDELKRLQQALKILSDAEKQLRLSSERSTWFTAALLQLGSGHNTESTQSSSSSKHSTKETNDHEHNVTKDSSFTVKGSSSALVSRASSGYSSPQSFPPSYKLPRSENLAPKILPLNNRSDCRSPDGSSTDDTYSNGATTCVSPDKLNLIWRRCIQGCHSETLRKLLSSHGKLASISETESTLIAHLVFEDNGIKSRAERYYSSIVNSIGTVLQQNVDVRIGLLSENLKDKLQSVSNSLSGKDTGRNKLFTEQRNVKSNNPKIFCKESNKVTTNLPRRSLACSEAKLQRTLAQGDTSSVQDDGDKLARSVVPSGVNDEASGGRGRGHELSVPRTNAGPIHEHRLESAWVQTSDKNQLEVACQSNPNRNQVLPQNGVNCENHTMSSEAMSMSSNNGIEASKISDNQGRQRKQTGGCGDHYAISPSLLHNNGFTANFDQENQGYESGPGCSGLFCWQPRKSYKVNVKKRIHGQSPKVRRFHCLGSRRGRKQSENISCKT